MLFVGVVEILGEDRVVKSRRRELVFHVIALYKLVVAKQNGVSL